MIISWILEHAFGLIGWCFAFLPVVPASVSLLEGIRYILYVFTQGASLFFLLVPAETFLVAIDVVFFFWLYTPLATFIMWVLRKLPFLGIE